MDAWDIKAREQGGTCQCELGHGRVMFGVALLILFEKVLGKKCESEELLVLQNVFFRVLGFPRQLA